MIQQSIAFFNLVTVTAFRGVDELVVDVFRVGTELVKHLLGLAAQFLESSREVALQIDLEIDVVVEISERLLGSLGKGIALFGGEVEAGEYERADDVDHHDDHQGDEE